MLKRNLVHSKAALLHLLLIGVFLQPYENLASDLSDADFALRTQQFKQAFSLYLDAAQNGNPEAQYRVANLYILGEGTPKNEAQAMSFLERSAAQNYSAASFQLGLRLKDSQPIRSQQLIQVAADQNYSPALKHLNLAVEKKGQNLSLERWLSAARKDDTDTLKILFEAGQHIDTQDTFGQTALFYAVHAKSQAAITWLLQIGANANHKDKQDLTPLQIAVDIGETKTVATLIQTGAHTHLVSPAGGSLLHLAINRGHRSLIPILIQTQVPVDVISTDGLSAADLAYKRGWEEESRILRKAGSPLTRVNSSSKSLQVRAKQWNSSYENNPISGLSSLISSSDNDLLTFIFPTAFHNALNDEADRKKLVELAIYARNADALALMKDAGVRFKHTQLLDIAKTSCVQCARILLSSGLNPLHGSDVNDAISTALKSRQASMARYLFETVKAQKQAQQRVGLYLVYATRAQLNQLAFLFLPNANPAVDEHHLDAYSYAAIHGDVALIRALQSQGLPLSNKDLSKRTPFFFAVENKNLECAKALLTKTLINQPTQSGISPLMVASLNKDPIAVQWLLEQSADVSFRNGRGDTALIYAAQAGASEVVKLLLQAGANRLVKNKNGMRAKDFVPSESELSELL